MVIVYRRFDRFRVEVEERRLTRNGAAVTLTSRDFDILLALIENSGQTVGKNDLMETIWEDTFVEEGNLNRHVSTLRKVLGDDPREQRFIKTIPKTRLPVYGRCPTDRRNRRNSRRRKLLALQTGH